MLDTVAVEIEVEVGQAMAEIVSILKKAKAGETPIQVLGEELARVGQLIAVANAVPGDVKESLPATLRAVSLGLVDVATLFL